MSAAAPTALPPLLAANPRLDQWVEFREPGRVRVSTGRVEIGQGVLTAMRQIAAEELDVTPNRIMLMSGGTELTPNEGYTAGSQSIQFGGVALRMACAEVRALFLDHTAAAFGLSRGDLAVRDGAIIHDGRPTGHDYWSLAGAVDLGRRARGDALTKKPGDYRVVGQDAPRVDLAAKVFGEPVFLHDMMLDGMLHARVVRQPRREATIKTVDEAALRRAAKGPIEIVRNGNFLAITGPDETVVDAVAAVAPSHVVWDGVDALNPFQEEARWLLQQPSIDRVVGAPPPSAPVPAANRYEASYTRMHIAHASVAPSCGAALYRDGRLQVWTHSQGVYPLRDALARTLKLDPAMISVKHVQGPGCYGHNGADDAAADAAAIAMHTPGKPVRVRWRREEEFGFEPVSPAMVVTARAALDDAGRPVDWTTEIWSGRHSSRPGGGGNLLAAEALPDPPPAPPATESSNPPGAGTRNGEPLYEFPAKRIVHHLIPETPVRTSSLRGLGATLNVFAIESAMDDLAERAGEDPVAYRLSVLRDARARAVVDRVAQLGGWRAGQVPSTGSGRGIGFARYKNIAAYAAVIAEVEVDESVRLTRVWCVCDAGLVINPDGATNQLEGGIIQAASWALKEGVRLDSNGISSRDWEGYTVLRFTEVPEITVELLGAAADLPALGVGEASGGPTVAAIGNAVAHALGARLRDLPLTRDRVMDALLKS
jgi:nicotinate dehydrogenase subunit B